MYIGYLSRFLSDRGRWLADSSSNRPTNPLALTYTKKQKKQTYKQTNGEFTLYPTEMAQKPLAASHDMMYEVTSWKHSGVRKSILIRASSVPDIVSCGECALELITIISNTHTLVIALGHFLSIMVNTRPRCADSTLNCQAR